MVRLFQSGLVIVFALFMSLPVFAQEVTRNKTVYLYTYHNKPPFIVNEPKRIGLYYDLAKYLSQLDSNHRFETIYLPRKRLDLMLQNETLDGAVIGVSPVWFGDRDESRFLWLSTIYPDRDEFVSLASSPFEYEDSDSLSGKIVAGVAGYYYFGINEAVQSDRLERIDTIGERQVLELIERERADFGIVSQSVFAYLKSVGELNDVYHFSERPHDEFDRRAFTLKKHSDIHQVLQKLTEGLQQDPVWQQMVEQYK